MTDKRVTAKIIHVHSAPACETCGVRRLCLPVSLDSEDLNTVSRMVKAHRLLQGNEFIYHIGDEFRSLYAIRSGAVKTYGLTSDGKEQITGFHLSGELVGMDAISDHIHSCNAVTLEETEVCEIPFDQLEVLTQKIPSLMHELTCIMSREIHAEEDMLIMIGKMRSTQRIACFLQNLYHRERQRGGGIDSIRLPMSREDVGNYLGLTVETVSRKLSSLQDQGVIQIEKRHIKFLDTAALGRLCSS